MFSVVGKTATGKSNGKRQHTRAGDLPIFQIKVMGISLSRCSSMQFSVYYFRHEDIEILSDNGIYMCVTIHVSFSSNWQIKPKYYTLLFPLQSLKLIYKPQLVLSIWQGAVTFSVLTSFCCYFIPLSIFRQIKMAP